ncbi:hypothetical protein EE612_008187 [Oryza sativa]|nr:hypothetical protein EE612_008187 [Oryza sativa]
MLHALSCDTFTVLLPLLKAYMWVAPSTTAAGYTLAMMHALPPPPKLSTADRSICTHAGESSSPFQGHIQRSLHMLVCTVLVSTMICTNQSTG